MTAKECKLDVMCWMSSLDPLIIPNVFGASKAAKERQLDVLRWLKPLDPPILHLRHLS